MKAWLAVSGFWTEGKDKRFGCASSDNKRHKLGTPAVLGLDYHFNRRFIRYPTMALFCERRAFHSSNTGSKWAGWTHFAEAQKCIFRGPTLNKMASQNGQFWVRISEFLIVTFHDKHQQKKFDCTNCSTPWGKHRSYFNFSLGVSHEKLCSVQWSRIFEWECIFELLRNGFIRAVETRGCYLGKPSVHRATPRSGIGWIVD